MTADAGAMNEKPQATPASCIGVVAFYLLAGVTGLIVGALGTAFSVRMRCCPCTHGSGRDCQCCRPPLCRPACRVAQRTLRLAHVAASLPADAPLELGWSERADGRSRV